MAKKQNSNNNSRYAVIGLWISIISFIALAIAGVMKAFEITGFYTPLDTTLLPRLLWGSFAGVFIGLGIFALLDPKRILTFLTGRQAKYGSNALITSIAFIAILVFGNILAQQNPIQFDWTEESRNTLASESVDALEALPQPVKATAFFSSRFNTDSTRDLLEKYRINSKGKFEFEFVDPDRNPIAAQNAGVTGDGRILLQMGDVREIVTTPSEQEITNGFIKLLNPEKTAVYFLSGEGEHSIEENSAVSYIRIRQALENKNYNVNTLNLEAEKIPDDANVLILAGPINPLSEQAVDALKSYLSTGGSLIVLQNPVPLTNFGDKDDLLADYLSSEWGITLNNDIIVDAEAPSSVYNATAVQYIQHPITEKMGGVGITLPYARSLSVSFELPNVLVTDLIYTTDQAWGETDFASIEAGQPAFDPATELVGPMLLTATAENTITGARLVVAGNSSFAIDDNFDFAGNGDFLVNSVDWSADKEELIALSSVQPTERTFVAPGAFQRMIMLAASVCLIPLAIIIMGATSWYARRKQG